MSEVKNEIVPEVNKIYKTRFTFKVTKFLARLDKVSRLDIGIPGLANCRLEVHGNQKKSSVSSKYVKLVFHMDAPLIKDSKTRNVSINIDTSVDIGSWSDEFRYFGQTSRAKDDFVNQTFLKSYMEGDAFILIGEITVKETGWDIQNDTMFKAGGGNAKLLQDIRSLASSGALSDFTFVVGSRELEVHKAILAARSPVFERMFTGNFQESTAKKQQIKDISADVFEEFLYYIYAGELRNPEMPAEELIVVADRYEVTDLLKMCEAKLLQSINDDNAESIFRLTSSIDCSPQLKKISFEILRSMFERFTISLPADFIHQPEKVYHSLMLKQSLEDAVQAKTEAEPEEAAIAEDSIAEDSMISTEDFLGNEQRSQPVSHVSRRRLLLSNVSTASDDTTDTDTDNDAATIESSAEAVRGKVASLHVSNISHDSYVSSEDSASTEGN